MMQGEEDLNQLVGYQLKETQSILRSRMDATLREIGLTTPQYVCLELLKRTPGVSNSDLARRAFVTRQSMNLLLRSLQDRGLLDRAEKPESGRALPAALSQAGAAILDQAAKRIHAVEHQMTSRLTAQQKKEVLLALASCADALRS